MPPWWGARKERIFWGEMIAVGGAEVTLRGREGITANLGGSL